MNTGESDKKNASEVSALDALPSARRSINCRLARGLREARYASAVTSAMYETPKLSHNFAPVGGAGANVPNRAPSASPKANTPSGVNRNNSPTTANVAAKPRMIHTMIVSVCFIFVSPKFHVPRASPAP